MKTKSIFKFLPLIIFLNLSLFAFAQKSPEKFGKIPIKELKENICPIDSGAHAYFIFDYGESYFEYANTKIRSNDPSQSKGFQLYFTRHFRIKIIDNQGFQWADIKIPLYHNDNDEEEVTKIKAFTYNLENGKIIKTKLSKKDIYKEEKNEHWTLDKFAMPGVREGSVIEVEYITKSDFYFNLQPWYFQTEIPVLQSEYHVRIPEYFNYNQTQKGYFPIERTTESISRVLTLTYIQKAEGMTVKEYTSTKTYRFIENVYIYKAKNIPAFPVEGYLRTEENYLSKIEFELNTTKFPNSAVKTYTTTWEDINYRYLHDYGYGKELNRSYYFKDEAETLRRLNQKDYNFLNSAFNLINSKMVWNGTKSDIVTSSLNKAYKNGGGNSADINLNLIALLRELGFNACPVLLSTQDHGIIHPAHPSITSFNYVIAMVNLAGDTLLMDATDPNAEINLLPIRCLNDRGRIVNDAGGGWINLMDYKPYSISESYQIEINDDLSMSGLDEMKLSDYAKYIFKTEFEKYSDVDEYTLDLENKTKGLTVNDLNIAGIDTIMENINVSTDFSETNYLDKIGEMVFFKPAFQPFVSENPFKLEKREYPVEFDYPYQVSQVYTYKVPENYIISEIPESLITKTPDGKIRYIYNIKQMGNNIFLTIMFSINSSLFLPDEYQILKQLYQMIIDKQDEQIVLKEAI